MQAMLSARLQKDTGFSLYLLWVPKSENKHQVFISVACSGATLWLRVKINIAEDIKNLHCTLYLVNNVFGSLTLPGHGF